MAEADFPVPDRPAGALFLSYASQDAEAAKRLCDGLRQAGIEVWFDQSELVGGDAWDQKIRRQIKECTLFVPVISAHTQARAEGYFRLEWLLAVERSRLMAEDQPFLLPVVVDDTPEATARVPEKFRDVQWTRLPGGEATPRFVDHVRNLLLAANGASGTAETPPAHLPPTANPPHAPASRRKTVWRWAAVAAALAVVGSVAWLVVREERRPPAPRATRPVATQTTSAPVKQAPTEVQKLLSRLWEIYELQENGTAEEWALAEDLGAQAVKLEPANADAWAAYAQAMWGNTTMHRSDRRGEALRPAQRAITLAPDSFEARFALANLQRNASATAAEAENSLRQLLAERPDDKRVLRVLAYTLRNRAQRANDTVLFETALGYLDRAAALPGGDASALMGKALILYQQLGRYAEAEAAIDAALKLRKFPNALVLKTKLVFLLDGRLDEALTLLQQAPASFWLKEGKPAFAAWLWLCRRKASQAHAALNLATGDYLEGSEFTGPKAVLTGMANKLSGNARAAQIEWQAALQVAERRLNKTPNDREATYWKAWLLAALGQKVEARVALQNAEALSRGYIFKVARGFPRFQLETAPIYLHLGENGTVLEALENREKSLRERGSTGDAAILRHRLIYEPTWDPLRGDERFEAVLKKLAETAKRTPAAKE